MSECLSVLDNMPDLSSEYVGGLFPVGKLSALVGDGGIGKSWSLVGSSLSVTSSKAFLPTSDFEYPISNDYKTLVCETEGRVASYHKRIKLLGGDTSKYYTPKSISEIPIFQNSDDRVCVTNFLSQNTDTRFMIVDSLSAFNLVDENSCEVLQCLSWLVEVAVRYQIAVVFSQLVNKKELDNNRLAKKNIRGFNGIPQMAEVIWAIDESPYNVKVKRLYQIKNNAEEQITEDFYYKLEQGSITWLEKEIGLSAFQAKKTNTINKLEQRFQIFEANKELKTGEIAALLLEQEPDSNLNSLRQWVSNKKNGR